MYKLPVIAVAGSSSSGSFSSIRPKYLRSDSALEVLGKSLRIYVRHFGVLLLTIVLPTLPFDLLSLAGFLKGESNWGIGGIIVSQFAAIFAFSAVCVVGSDICVGNKPSLRRSYRRIFGAPFGYVVANSALVYLCLVLPAILFVFVAMGRVWWVTLTVGVLAIASVPLLVLHLMYVPAISALEMKPGFRRALRRSSVLGRGYRLRAFVVLSMLLMVSGVVAVILAFFTSMVAELSSTIGLRLYGILTLRVLLPFVAIAALLSYYDLRSRTEAFDLPSFDETMHD